nr:thiamine-phosphate kinase [Brevibacillus fulvus]
MIREWTGRSYGLEGNGVSVGLGDDAAVFSVAAGMEVVACCDAMIETVHFLRETMSPCDIGYKAMISNISDIAAMGGIPRYALVTIGVSPGWQADECKRIYEGIDQAAKLYNVRMIGGDTVATPDALHLSITLLGEVESGRALRRSSARAGDLLFLTGPVGSSAAGLDLLLSRRERAVEPRPDWQTLVAQHQRPTAQVEAGRLLLKSGLGRALNDISDGLASEAWEIAEASGCKIVIEAERVPMLEEMRSYAASVGKNPLDWAFYGGEDYQLIGSVPATEAETLAAAFAEHGLPFYLLGTVEAGQPGVWLSEQGSERPLPKAGYNHFKDEAGEDQNG